MKERQKEIVNVDWKKLNKIEAERFSYFYP